jgi:hypothetical protein
MGAISPGFERTSTSAPTPRPRWPTVRPLEGAAMPIERIPKEQIAKDYVPPHSFPYRVGDKDSFVSVALRYKLQPWQLIYANFKTRNEGEVNWYLRTRVGCNRPTRNGKNWRFSASASPGIIHIPSGIITLPPLAITGKLPAHEVPHVWFGIGETHSGTLVLGGLYNIVARLYKLTDEYSNVENATIMICGVKVGPGLGGSGSLVFVLAYGYDDPGELNGKQDPEWDFDLDLGAKLGDWLKGMRGIGKVIDSIEKFKKARYAVENAIKSRGFRTSKPGIYTFPIPGAGLGLQVWAGRKWTNVVVTNTGRGIP